MREGVRGYKVECKICRGCERRGCEVDGKGVKVDGRVRWQRK